jgi:hypothetical protein
MTYENAPQTKMMATHCMLCGRELCDAVSVEVGMGPVCRKRAGYHEVATDDNRQAANKLIHTVACSKDTDQRIAAMTELLDFGFIGVVQAMLAAVAEVKIAMTDATHPHGAGRLAVKSMYEPEVVKAFQTVPGRRWDRTNKINTFPVSSRHKLWTVLQTYYHGSIGVSPKGIFKVAKGAQATGPVKKEVA